MEGDATLRGFVGLVDVDSLDGAAEVFACSAVVGGAADGVVEDMDAGCSGAVIVSWVSNGMGG